jgi:hypothetical protein
MKNFLLTFVLSSSFLTADMNLYQTGDAKISVQNAILAKVNGNTISVVDVMKKMDLLLHQNYPQYVNSSQARFQFYSNSWRPILMEMIDTELILSDAAEKEIKLTDGDVREEMEERFGPSILVTLDKIGLSYDDAWRIVKNELIVRRMMWFFVQSKAIQSVGPQSIKLAYKEYLGEHPPYQEYKYRVLTVTADQERAEKIHQELLASNQSLEDLLPTWKECSLSNEFAAKDYELSTAHQAGLASLETGQYSLPIAGLTRDRKTVHRIFFLSEKSEHPAPAFEDMANRIKNELVQGAMSKESEYYLKKLRTRYGFDSSRLKETVPDNLQPFAIQ